MAVIQPGDSQSAPLCLAWDPNATRMHSTLLASPTTAATPTSSPSGTATATSLSTTKAATAPSLATTERASFSRLTTASASPSLLELLLELAKGFHALLSIPRVASAPRAASVPTLAILLSGPAAGRDRLRAK